MALRTIQLQVTFGASFAAVAASEIYYRVVSYGGTQRIARTNSGVVSSSDGSFYAAPSIDDAWLPARVEWDNGGAAGLGSATRRASASIDQAELLAAIAGASGGGVTASQIWAHANRTLTSYPPAIQATMPSPGIGLHIPGARQENAPVQWNGAAIAGTTVCLRARVVDANGDWIQRASVSAIESVVTNLQSPASSTTASHTVADSIFDELQADGTYTEDAAGYNVAVTISGTRLAAAKTAYRITLTLTTTDGPIKLLWEVQTRDA